MIFIISLFIFIFNIIFNYFIKLLLCNNFYFKIIILIILIIIAYFLYKWPYIQRCKLSRLRKIKYKFPKQYIIRDKTDLVITFVFVLIYVSIFIIGILYLRFLNVTKEINLYDSWRILQAIIKNFSNSDLILYTMILLLLVINYIYLWKNVQAFFKLQKMRLYFLSFIYESFFEKMFWILHKFNISNILTKMTQYLFLICYFLGFIKPKNSLNPFTVDTSILEVYPKAAKVKKREYLYIFRNTKFITPKWLELLGQGITLREFKLHYYFLLLIFFYDIFFNNMVLQITYKIMPYIFIYEIWVRYSKFFLFRNRSYDTFIFYFLYYDITEQDNSEIVLANRSWSREFMNNVIKFYVYNGFINKEFFDNWQKIDRSFSIQQLYDYKKYYADLMLFVGRSLKETKFIIIIFVFLLLFYG